MWCGECADSEEATENEFGLGSLSFPMTKNMLSNPNVWIADTGASTHTTSSTIGLVNKQKAEDGAGIHMASGKVTGTKTIGDIKGTFVNKDGSKMMQAKLPSVHVIPNGQFNLFSLSKMQQEGWTLGGNKEAIWIVKGQAKINFRSCDSDQDWSHFCWILQEDDDN